MRDRQGEGERGRGVRERETVRASGAERREGGALALGPWAQKVLQNN